MLHETDVPEDAFGAWNRRPGIPFFIDPVDGMLKIEKGSLVEVYRRLQTDAESQYKENN